MEITERLSCLILRTPIPQNPFSTGITPCWSSRLLSGIILKPPRLAVRCHKLARARAFNDRQRSSFAFVYKRTDLFYQYVDSWSRRARYHTVVYNRYGGTMVYLSCRFSTWPLYRMIANSKVRFSTRQNTTRVEAWWPFLVGLPRQLARWTARSQSTSTTAHYLRTVIFHVHHLR